MNTPINKVVIVGRDAAAWLTANALAQAFAHTGLHIEVVELPGLLVAHDAYASLPALEAMHRLLGLDENTVLKQSGGTFSLGQSFANFSRAVPPFFHPYGAHGTQIDHRPFAQYWIKAHLAGLKVPFEDFAINAVAAKAGRFFIPDNEIAGFAKCGYGYHLRAQSYVAYLRARALAKGVKGSAARHFSAQLDSETGYVQGLVLNDGRTITGDLFIDATGQDSLLLGDALKTPFESWSAWFPDNRVLTMSTAPAQDLPPYSQVRALGDSVLHRVPLQGLTSITHVYNSQYVADEAAFESAVVVAGRPLRTDAVVSDLRVGLRDVVWAKNCIAIGEAACAFNPIDAPALQAIHLGIAHLVSLFPRTLDMAPEAAEYNSRLRDSFERIRDFQICHFRLNRNFDQPYWDRFRAMTVPDSLAYKLDLFAARGAMALLDDETFEADSWMSVMIGHGLIPAGYDPLIDLRDEGQMIQQFQQMLGFIGKHVQDMVSHEVYIEIYATRHS